MRGFIQEINTVVRLMVQQSKMLLKKSTPFQIYKMSSMVVAASLLVFSFQNCSNDFQPINEANLSSLSQMSAPECGIANGAGQLKTPDINTLCAQGTPTTVTGSGPFEWSCVERNGANVSCSSQLMVNGSCGVLGNSDPTKASAITLCPTGTASAVTGNNPYYWSCEGSNGGTTANCSDSAPIDAVCGSASNTAQTSAPSGTAVCAAGTLSSAGVKGSGPWTWSCQGVNGGSDAACKADLIVSGVCGSANGTSSSSAPTSGFCSSGTYTPASSWSWSCVGASGGTSANCSASPIIAGACGTANGQSSVAAPTSNLCLAGTATAVTGVGPFGWICNGVGGGKSVSCGSLLQVNGLCGSQAATPMIPTSPCAAGTASAINLNANVYTWSCAGISGGTTSSVCSAPQIVAGSCGSANGTTMSAAPTNTTSGLCAAGTPAVNAGTYTWSCKGINSGADATNCSATTSGASATVQSVAAGGLHTCRILAGGALQCWGLNSYGQIGNGITGNGTVINQLTPVTVISSGVTQVSAGGSHTCAIVNGALQCWGWNSDGQIGNGTTTNQLTPVTVISSGVTQVSAGGYHTCAIVNGALQCWGWNSYGQIGNGTVINQLTPVTVISS